MRLVGDCRRAPSGGLHAYVPFTHRERGVSTNLLSSGYARLIRVIDEFAKHICTSIYAGYARRWSGNWTGCRITTSAVP